MQSPIPRRGMTNNPNKRKTEKKIAVPCSMRYFFFRMRKNIIMGDEISSRGKTGSKIIGAKNPIRRSLIFPFWVCADGDSKVSEFIKK